MEEYNNSGYNNSGHRNSGYNNSGNRNSGDNNSGHRNSGGFNSGNRNSGGFNSGGFNSGGLNSGGLNSGDYNAGYNNSGDYNAGHSNSGNYNSGNRNSGDNNSGNRNSGNYNSGYGCSTNRETGIFCNSESTINIFNKDSNLKWDEIDHPSTVGLNLTEWINESDMTDTEKKENENFKTTRGYLKTIDYKEAWIKFWSKTPKSNKDKFLNLPNFDSEIFKDITGIEIFKDKTCDGKIVEIDGLEYELKLLF